jgi:two-component system chemotaxis response regulator CheY
MPHNVLIVDDYAPLRRRIRSALEDAGIDVCGEATNGQEGIQKVKELSPGVVILNISMPKMSGLQALPEIIRCCPNAKVVMFTIDDAEELRRQALLLGARAYIVKTAPLEELIAEVRRLFGEKA